MALGRRLARSRPVDYWPGFVDALSVLLLAIVFLLSVFMITQFYLSQEVGTRDTAIERLNREIAELTNLLSLERTGRRSSENDLANLRASLAEAQAAQGKLQSLIDAGNADSGRAAAAGAELDQQKQVTARALAQVEALNQQIAALRRQLAAIEDALSASESREKESQARVADLGARLNVALAQKVQELARYRSDFFGRLRQILGSRPDIRVVGDRFVFQSEVLFDTGQAVLKSEGNAELDKIAAAIGDLDREIPPDIPWVLRVDGHTDKRPLSGSGEFKSNWALSSARAIAVVQYLVSKGIPPQRLVAAGFGEFQPLELADSDEAYRRNRRIELKLTER